MSENIGLRNIGITTTDIAIYEFKKNDAYQGINWWNDINKRMCLGYRVLGLDFY